MRRAASTPIRLALAVGIVCGLSACATTADSDGEPTSADSPAPAITGTPIPLSCEQLVPTSALTGQWAGYAPDPSFTPSSVGAEIAGFDGLVCGWASEAGSFEVAVAQLDADVIEDLKNASYEGSTAVPTYGKPPEIEGYFTTASGSGVADVFVDDFWIETTGTAYVEPGDPAQLIAAAIAALRG
ncbi:hypothetical protein HQQ80_07050 [Microbacteriaceae bacterium VKM Ac-2855]|nr:hypothetical protein [Microbacteriaceae bacterium VKM Ac-2855]